MKIDNGNLTIEKIDDLRKLMLKSSFQTFFLTNELGEIQVDDTSIWTKIFPTDLMHVNKVKVNIDSDGCIIHINIGTTRPVTLLDVKVLFFYKGIQWGEVTNKFDMPLRMESLDTFQLDIRQSWNGLWENVNSRMCKNLK